VKSYLISGHIIKETINAQIASTHIYSGHNMILMKRLYLAILLLQFSLILTAQVPAAMTSTEIYRGIKKLNVLGSVLYIAAHPDDENTRLLAYLSKERQYRTGYLSLTRGDGGQNLIGDEQGVELGLIRTQELLAARRVDGAEQFFSRAYDFGYSKTADETLKKWDKEKILSDIVWIIRKFQPDVIITRFPGDIRAGHGHHWSSALLANEAFTAAADPTKFPEHFQHGVKPWQAKRILWNAFIFGSNTVPEGAFRMDVGTYNILLGKGYGEIASESRSNHKSQGFGAARTRGETFEHFITTGGDKPVTDIMDGVNTTWDRTANASLQQQVNQLVNEFSFENPDRSLKGLIEVYRTIKKLQDSYWKEQKLKEVQVLIESVAGLFADATATSASVVQGDSLRINFTLNKRNESNVILKHISIEQFDSSLNATLGTNRNLNISKTIFIDDQKKISQPYWLEHSMPNGSFEVRDQQLIGKAENEPSLKVNYDVVIEGEPFIITRALQFKFTDPVKGEIYQPLVVLPKLEVQFDKDNYISIKGTTVNGNYIIKSNLKNNPSNYLLQTKHSSNWKVGKDSFYHEGPSAFVTSSFTPFDKKTNSSEQISLTAKNHTIYPGYTKTIAYDHIPTITYFPPAKANLVTSDVKTKRKRVGYITGAGDKIPDALEQMGYDVVVLEKDDITTANLKKLDAVITGIRAYNVHAYLSDKYDVLMSFVNNGGNLIVQFNTNNQVGPVRAKIGPYNFNISRTRVTEEDAKVTFALPAHPVFNIPNKITEADFEGWVQERSVYEADQLDSAFVTPLEMNDQNEKPGKGSLIIAKYGKGNFVYTGLALFRQLPAGVPGAYRLLANLVALPKNK
jgi:LmbE family N-acetylglucosaminyl deacetylase